MESLYCLQYFVGMLVWIDLVPNAVCITERAGFLGAAWSIILARLDTYAIHIFPHKFRLAAVPGCGSACPYL